MYGVALDFGLGPVTESGAAAAAHRAPGQVARVGERLAVDGSRELALAAGPGRAAAGGAGPAGTSGGAARSNTAAAGTTGWSGNADPNKHPG